MAPWGARVLSALRMRRTGLPADRTRSEDHCGAICPAAIRSAAEIPSRMGTLTSRITRSGFSAEASSSGQCAARLRWGTSSPREVKADQHPILGDRHAKRAWPTPRTGRKRYINRRADRPVVGPGPR